MARSTSGSPSALGPVLGWIGVLWVVFACDLVLTHRFYPQAPPWSVGFLADHFGLVPLSLPRLLCIPTAPLIHGNFAHLLANSIGLLLVGWLSNRYSPRLTAIAVAYAVLYGGILAWLLGDVGAKQVPTCHIGASGIIFGLVGFLIGNGIFRRGCLPVILALFTAVVFGGILPEALPQPQLSQPISWQMHLGGLLGGLSAAWHKREEPL